MCFFVCVCVGVGVGVSRVLGWAPVSMRLLWIINIPLAADKRVPACSALTFRGPVSLRFKHARTRSHSPHLRSFSAWSHELVNLDRCTFLWHRQHAGSHLIYTASRGTEASLTSLISPMPCSHTHTVHSHSHTQTRCHFPMPDWRPFPSLLICSTSWSRFSEALADSPFINAKQIFYAREEKWQAACKGMSHILEVCSS